MGRKQMHKYARKMTNQVSDSVAKPVPPVKKWYHRIPIFGKIIKKRAGTKYLAELIIYNSARKQAINRIKDAILNNRY